MAPIFMKLYKQKLSTISVLRTVSLEEFSLRSARSHGHVWVIRDLLPSTAP